MRLDLHIVEEGLRCSIAAFESEVRTLQRRSTLQATVAVLRVIGGMRPADIALVLPHEPGAILVAWTCAESHLRKRLRCWKENHD